MKHRKQFFVELSDGVKREVRFTVDVLASICETVGKDFGDLAFDLKTVPVMISLALVNDQLSPKQVGQLIDPWHIADVITQVQTAISGKPPEPATETDPN